MSPSVPLLNRVRGEFLEMPGLRLNVEQAQRLWNLDRASCESLLSSLVEARFLSRYADDAYGMLSRV
jgi:DNA-binding IclR family transcriptional regulator